MSGLLIPLVSYSLGDSLLICNIPLRIVFMFNEVDSRSYFPSCLPSIQCFSFPCNAESSQLFRKSVWITMEVWTHIVLCWPFEEHTFDFLRLTCGTLGRETSADSIDLVDCLGRFFITRYCERRFFFHCKEILGYEFHMLFPPGMYFSSRVGNNGYSFSPRWLI